ncbi:dermonecrotic toxin StSicTox-betaIB1i [Parasteatoda tepidariorum]|nr:dermonecrotic toxin StSicTox-betaIB1i [Parasteatoda tepidariorum]
MVWNLLILFILKVVTSAEDNRRPIWNIAHMVNTLGEVDSYLDQGANGLEFDVYFDGENPVITYHPVPCDCFRTCMLREKLDTYLEYMRDITTPGSPKYRKELVFLFMDLKVSSIGAGSLKHAGENIAKKLLDIYWQNGEAGGQAFILVSLPYVSHIELFHGFLGTLEERNATFRKDKIGFEFSGNEDLKTIEYVLQTNNVSSNNFWQGDGITNCLPRGTYRLIDAINSRDYKEKSYMSKVYWWTVDKSSTMQRILRLGVDGMITNHPDRLVEVLKDSEFASTFRLASIEDSPWTKHPAEKTYYRHNCTSLPTEEEVLYNI